MEETSYIVVGSADAADAKTWKGKNWYFVRKFGVVTVNIFLWRTLLRLLKSIGVVLKKVRLMTTIKNSTSASKDQMLQK